MIKVAETATGVWNYHLRDDSSKDMSALCGEAVGWDTGIPIEAYERGVKGYKDHVPSKWCSDCWYYHTQR